MRWVQAVERSALALLVALGVAGCALPAGRPSARSIWLKHDGSGYRARGESYVLTVSARGIASLSEPGGSAYTTLPLGVEPDGASLPGTPTTTVRGSVLTLDWGKLATAEVHTYTTSIVVRFAMTKSWAQQGVSSDQVDFFSTGSTAIGLGAMKQGFTPQSGPQLAPSGQYMAFPFVSTSSPAPNGTNYYAFAPPPLDIALQYPAGWLGIGLVQVPDATSLWLTPKGAIAVDYPWRTMAGFADTGAGGMWQGMLRFPQFVLTFAPGAYREMGAYGNALVALGVVDKPPLAQQKIPSWWYEPLVCTFGQQEVEGITNFAPGKGGYTAAWVQSFASQWAQRFGTKNFTLIIDATWQQDPGNNRVVGSPLPGSLFGGIAGMRQLIDALHAQGIHVLLWWQAWGRTPGTLATQLGVWHAGSIDPTSAQFPAYVKQVIQTLLGSGPGDLNADGLKIDFNYWAPDAAGYPWANPALGMGTAASYRYFQTFYQDAHAVKPDAMITASIAAPQFANVMDAVRLNDASSEAQWQSRARIVSAAMPQVLIDSDGGSTYAATAMEHFLTAAVYGIPDDYYLTRWANGPISAQQASIIGSIMRLGGQRRIGTPIYRGPGDWEMVSSHRVTAQDLFSPQINGPVGLDVWSDTRTLTVLSAYDGTLDVPLYGGRVASAISGGKSIPTQPVTGGVAVALNAGQSVTITLSHAAAPLAAGAASSA